MFEFKIRNFACRVSYFKFKNYNSLFQNKTKCLNLKLETLHLNF